MHNSQEMKTTFVTTYTKTDSKKRVDISVYNYTTAETKTTL